MLEIEAQLTQGCKFRRARPEACLSVIPTRPTTRTNKWLPREDPLTLFTDPHVLVSRFPQMVSFSTLFQARWPKSP